MCGSEVGFTGVQSIVEDDTYSVMLNQFGGDLNCKIWKVDEGTYIEKVFFAYNDSRITYFKVSAEDDFFSISRGQQGPDDQTFEQSFNKYEPLAGFAVYQTD